jgi:hypothetical protein
MRRGDRGGLNNFSLSTLLRNAALERRLRERNVLETSPDALPKLRWKKEGKARLKSMLFRNYLLARGYINLKLAGLAILAGLSILSEQG